MFNELMFLKLSQVSQRLLKGGQMKSQRKKKEYGIYFKEGWPPSFHNMSESLVLYKLKEPLVIHLLENGDISETLL